ncbi:MAG: hypothetical protein K2J08_06740 [Ruminococcus sp.]|nr:hypothetical protein [Ruminococcus sp.]
MKKLIFILLCAVCLVSCSDTSVSEEISSSEEVSVTETVTTTVSENKNETADIEIPKNAEYKQTATIYNSHGFFEKIVNIFDENDNVLINLVYISENGEPPTSWTIYTYDTDNRLIKEDFYCNNRLLNYTEYEYDENGIIISDTEYYNINNDEVQEIRTEYIYNDNGILSAKQTYQQNGNKSYSYHYEYDEQNRLIKENFNGRINSCCSYSYDENGNISEKTDNGEYGITVAYYTYDDNNRLISAEEYNDDELIHTYEYEYEKL